MRLMQIYLPLIISQLISCLVGYILPFTMWLSEWMGVNWIQKWIARWSVIFLNYFLYFIFYFLFWLIESKWMKMMLFSYFFVNKIRLKVSLGTTHIMVFLFWSLCSMAICALFLAANTMNFLSVDIYYMLVPFNLTCDLIFQLERRKARPPSHICSSVSLWTSGNFCIR